VTTKARTDAAADPQLNRETARRGEELAAADATVRGASNHPDPGERSYPKAASREEQEANAAEAAKASAINVTGTADGVMSVLPAVGGTTNMGLTATELQAQLDDGAVDSRGRYVGVYLDDLQAAEAALRRAKVEGMADEVTDEMKAAAERVRQLASTVPAPASDAGKTADETAMSKPKASST
jgi:hypothetical protein